MIEILIGVSCAGKSTYAQERLKENSNLIRVNRDDLRLCNFGASQTDTEYYKHKNLKKREDYISVVANAMIREALNNGKDVIIDNTNLDFKYIKAFIDNFNHLSDIKLTVFEEDYVVIKMRLSLRFKGSDNIGYIDKQFRQFEALKNKIGDRLFYPKQDYYLVQGLLPCYIVDLDGTLALKGNRGIFEEEKVFIDRVNDPVARVIRGLAFSNKIIYLSGRTDSCRSETQRWLSTNNLWFPTSALFMRPTGDSRADWIVKEELFDKYVHGRYNTIGVFDDRMQVIENTWNKLGVFVFNVNQGNIRF